MGFSGTVPLVTFLGNSPGLLERTLRNMSEGEKKTNLMQLYVKFMLSCIDADMKSYMYQSPIGANVVTRLRQM